MRGARVIHFFSFLKNIYHQRFIQAHVLMVETHARKARIGMCQTVCQTAFAFLLALASSSVDAQTSCAAGKSDSGGVCVICEYGKFKAVSGECDN